MHSKRQNLIHFQPYHVMNFLGIEVMPLKLIFTIKTQICRITFHILVHILNIVQAVFQTTLLNVFIFVSNDEKVEMLSYAFLKSVTHIIQL